jgi:hypothetical protein
MDARVPILDKQIRCALTVTLRERDATAAIINELPLLRTGRADVAYVNGVMAGYEIKSEGDTLSRLPLQIPMYEAVFDYCSIVVAPVHLKRARAALPRSWGILLADECEGTVVIRHVRKAAYNRNTQCDALVRLMWKDELVECLRTNGIAASTAESVCYLWQKMAMVPKPRIMLAARTALASRAGV